MKTKKSENPARLLAAQKEYEKKRENDAFDASVKNSFNNKTVTIEKSNFNLNSELNIF